MTSDPASSELLEIDEFRLIRPLGDPGGPAYLAHDRLLDRAVVVRFLPEGGLAAARVLARVSHPHLARVHRVRDGQRPYLVLDHPRGNPLDALEAPLPARQALEVGRALAGALCTLDQAGLAHGDVRAGRVVLGDGGPQLFGLDGAHEADAAARREDARALVALLRLLGLDLPEAASAEELARELDLRLRPEDAAVDNPYRGLRAYDGADRAAFFGRSQEVDELLARLRGEPWLVVAGRSGAGKSSLVRAGLAPAIAEGALDGLPRWDVAVMAPGARPLAALASCLAPCLGRAAAELEAGAREKPILLAHLARARAGAGLCLVIDPLDEVMTVAPPAERDAFLEALARFGTLAPGVRVLMTLRSELMAPLSELGVAGRDLLRATALCGPMTREGLREAITAPAGGLGFTFETPAMVEALAAEAHGHEAALPLLSFTLAELWRSRDPGRRVIPEAALARLGGLGSALARHGDLVLGAMGPAERRQARRLLVLCATGGHRSRADLLADGGAPAAAALDALVAGRLIVAAEQHELAHPALASAWPRLGAWLDEDSGARAAAARLETAARDWEKLGRPDAALLTRRQLAELPPGAAGEFVERSRAAARRSRRRRNALLFGLPSALLLFLGAAWGVVAWRDGRQALAYVDARLAEAARAAAEADRLEAAAVAARREAFARYDANDMDGGDARWTEAQAVGARELEALGAASQAVDLARAREPASPQARATAAELLYRWLLTARREANDPVLDEELRARLAFVDDGTRIGRLSAPARLSVTTSPPGAGLVLHAVTRGDRYLEDAGRPIGTTPLELAPGDYLVDASAPGRWPTRYPLLLDPGADERIVIVLPEASRIPAGYVYVPAGRTLFGLAGDEATRRSYRAQPEHPIEVAAFLIGKEEVTWGEYLVFLAALPPGERASRLVTTTSRFLGFDPDGTPVLTWLHQRVRVGQPLCRTHRTRHACRDWLRMPVAGLRREDAEAYASWLAASVPGARLCSEREWERAARGADGRLFPAGDALRAGEANFDETWGRDELQMGEDEVGSYPLDVSLFGVLDLAGNVSEWVGDTIDGAHPEVHVARGGFWFGDPGSIRAPIRIVYSEVRGPPVGFRVCAPAP